MLSRREVIRSCSLLLPAVLTRRVAGRAASLSVELVQEFIGARLLDLAPDGSKLCLEEWKKPNYPLSVVELGSWRRVFAGDFRQRALAASFFADGEAIFLNFAGGKNQVVHRQTIIEIRTGSRTDLERQFDPFEYLEQMSPVDDRALLVARYGRKLSLQSLARLELPNYREISRAVVASQRADDTPGTDVSLSANRKFAVYWSDHVITCRSTEDLSVMWTFELSVDVRAFPLAVSANGDYVAAVIGHGSFDGQFQHYKRLYTMILDGRRGAEVTRLPIYGKLGIAISPGGNLLAVITDGHDDKGAVLPTVDIYDVSSGVKLASVVHDRIPKGRRQTLLAGCGAAFTSDGRYIITSGMVTKVWKLGD